MKTSNTFQQYASVAESIQSTSSSRTSRLQADAWDRPGIIQQARSDLMNGTADSTARCRLVAVSAAHSGDWLHALPISACGLSLDDEAMRVAVGLRLGVNLCISGSPSALAASWLKPPEDTPFRVINLPPA